MSNLSNARFLTLSAVAYSSLEDIEESEARFIQHLHYVFTGYHELKLKHHKAVKTVEIPLKPWKQIDMPLDLMHWSKVGFRTGDLIRVFTNDPNIGKYFDVVDCVPQENLPQTPIEQLATFDVSIPFYGFNGVANDNKMFGNLLQYNHLGYFSCDWERRVINFKETVSGIQNIYLEYVSDGINYEGTTVINPILKQPLVNWVHWQRKLHNDKYSLADRREAERIYKNSLDELAMVQLELTMDDIWEALRAGMRQTPKK